MLFTRPKRSASKRDRAGQQPDHQGDDARQKAELAVGQAPFGLQQREHGIQHLPRHVIGNQQAEGEREHHPGVGRDASAC